jgi:DNA helicase-2/ATP-dependent DNA helicase PcrA
MKKKTKLILGPPGTGKTTTLINLMEELLDEGVLASQICFVSFTRKAATEARERAITKFGLPEEEFQWFRTLHSLAFKFHNIDKQDVMGFSDYINICQMLGLTISSQRVDIEDGFSSNTTTKGDRLFFLENMSRVTKVGLPAIFQQYPNDDIDFRELELLATTLNDYKRVRTKLDFTDMICKFNVIGAAPDIQVLIVDEAQDLAPVQWEMVEILSKPCGRIFIAGDDDQAIYAWAGADVKHFVNLAKTDVETQVLEQSYRIPDAVYRMAMRVANRMKERTIKEYRPRPQEGTVMYNSDLDQIDMSQGTWLLLARNIFYLQAFTTYCLEKGYLYYSKHGSAIDQELPGAIVNWEKLRRGEKLIAKDVKVIYNYMRTSSRIKFGCKKLLDQMKDNLVVDIVSLQQSFGLLTVDIWHQAMNKIKPAEVQYFIAALKRGEKMMREPRIVINTIHGVKGGEADNVVLCSDMARRTYEEYQSNPDAEHRVWYVGVTRTKEKLHVLEPRTQYFYDLL